MTQYLQESQSPAGAASLSSGVTSHSPERKGPAPSAYTHGCVVPQFILCQLQQATEFVCPRNSLKQST